jgi:hypothetical protein
LNNLLPALATTILVAVPLAAQNSNLWQFGAGLSYSKSTGGFVASVLGEKPLTDHFAIRASANHSLGDMAGAYDEFIHDVSQRGMDLEPQQA